MSKYHNKKAEYQGIKFDSIAERDRYIDLINNENVKELQLQVPFILIPKNDLYRALKYKADFVYVSGDTRVVEDVKAVKTKEFAIKEKLFYHVYGYPITIYDVKSKRKKSK